MGAKLGGVFKSGSALRERVVRWLGFHLIHRDRGILGYHLGRCSLSKKRKFSATAVTWLQGKAKSFFTIILAQNEEFVKVKIFSANKSVQISNNFSFSAQVWKYSEFVHDFFMKRRYTIIGMEIFSGGGIFFPPGTI